MAVSTPQTMFALVKLVAWLTIPATLSLAESHRGVADTLFWQETHEPHWMGSTPGVNDVRSIAIDRSGAVWAATKAGVFVLQRRETNWLAAMNPADAGPAFTVMADPGGSIWAGAWNGFYRQTNSLLEKVPGTDHPVTALAAQDEEVIGLGPDGCYRFQAGALTRFTANSARSITAAAFDARNDLWIATRLGLYRYLPRRDVTEKIAADLLGAALQSLEFAEDGKLWIGGLGGVTVLSGTKRVACFTPTNGLPSIEVQCVRHGPDGRNWIGTSHGVVCYDGRSWSLRHSRRWLMDDNVRDVNFDDAGTAWTATRGGVSAIRRRQMTLSDKADYFLGICLARHVREPGLVEKCLLKTPGDVGNWSPRDDDNDGQYTGMYLAMESFRYAVTKDPQARVNAKRAFHALRFLQKVTETPGFFARTVIPASWHSMADPNETISDRAWAVRQAQDPRAKRVENHWRPSQDGKWLWKGDTSSDEVTGHFFGYLCYYDFAADAQEAEAVRAHVRRVMDYIIAGGYVFKDIDGTHTRWGVWSPESLNDDPDWAADQQVNSVEILSFLQVAYHMTGEAKYRKEYLRLIREHHYAENARHAKTIDPSFRTHIDDELLALAYPGLLRFEDDPGLRRIYRESLEEWHKIVRGDRSPFFNFTHDALLDIGPGRSATLADSIAFLRAAPLDLVRWTVDNSQREDMRVVRLPEFEHHQTDRLPPPDERGVMRWDENPFRAVQGDGGRSESDGVYWLLPYWMGRYYGFIQP